MALVAFSSLPLPLSLMAAPRKTASTWPIKAAPACICRASHGGTRAPARSALFRSFLLIIYAPNTHRFSFNYRPFTQTHLPQMRYFLASFLLDDRWKKKCFLLCSRIPLRARRYLREHARLVRLQLHAGIHGAEMRNERERVRIPSLSERWLLSRRPWNLPLRLHAW